MHIHFFLNCMINNYYSEKLVFYILILEIQLNTIRINENKIFIIRSRNIIFLLLF
jgi:hypothetical protein